MSLLEQFGRKISYWSAGVLFYNSIDLKVVYSPQSSIASPGTGLSRGRFPHPILEPCAVLGLAPLASSPGRDPSGSVVQFVQLFSGTFEYCAEQHSYHGSTDHRLRN